VSASTKYLSSVTHVRVARTTRYYGKVRALCTPNHTDRRVADFVSMSATGTNRLKVRGHSLDRHRLYVSWSLSKHRHRYVFAGQQGEQLIFSHNRATSGRSVRYRPRTDTGIESQHEPACRCVRSSTVKLTIAIFSLIGPRQQERYPVVHLPPFQMRCRVRV
jgi:hypothetical protein